MAINEYLPFAAGPGANVMTQAHYEQLAQRLTGFTSGVALSDQLNKAWRQSSVIASVLAQFIADRTGQDVLDDGDMPKLLAQLHVAIFHGMATEAQLQAHVEDHDNPHEVTLAQIGAAAAAALQAHVDDLDNPHQVTLAQLGGAPLESPAFTGSPTAPTPATGDNDTSIATTAFVQSAIAGGYTGNRGVIGWRRYPDGTIEQWGRISGVWTEGTGPNITFPIAFPNQCESVTLTNWNRDGGGSGDWISIDCFGQVTGDPSATGFGTFVQKPGDSDDYWGGCFWTASGY